jgi:hypothetical protein
VTVFLFNELAPKDANLAMLEECVKKAAPPPIEEEHLGATKTPSGGCPNSCCEKRGLPALLDVIVIFYQNRVPYKRTDRSAI